MKDLVGLIPLLPLLGWFITGLFGKKLSRTAAGLIACSTVLGSFAISLGLFFEVEHLETHRFTVDFFSWISAGTLQVPFSFLIDPLSCLFLLIITGIGFLIHVYSFGYMHDDDGFARFFSYLNLFVFFMLLLVLGSNYLIMFVGWEGVGLCSYLLIGFWFKNTAYNKAANKAFIMNRIGDLGFLLGIILIFLTFDGNIGYAEVFDKAKYMSSGDGTITAITLLLFIGAMGKSAQIPLYTWLPDAMAGPTPVSALIHAATMVTAGIYMVARSNILYALSPVAMEVVAITGIVTALFAASIGLLQNDIKKVLAYSTVSQLGYMFLGLGVGAFTGAVFHVMTHAFFKALLFLGAGSVIHAMSGEQDIRKMGGLKKALPITYMTFLIGTLAIAGFPLFSGFFSKDEILAHAFDHNKVLWFLGMLGAVMTTFYMFRLFFVTFWGKFNGTKEQQYHLHESPKSMTIPLMVLAVLSLVGGFVGLPEIIGTHRLEEFLAPVFADSKMKLFHAPLSHDTEWTLLITASIVCVVVIAFAYQYFVVKGRRPAEEGEEISPLAKTVSNKYYIDELYEALFTKPLNWLSDKFYKIFELQVVDGIVNETGKLVNTLSGVLRLLQTGRIGFYLFAMVLSIILILFVTTF